MNLRTRMWIQIGGALFFAAIAIAEASGFKSPTFGLPMGWIIFALAAATMAFETWRTYRTWRKMKVD